MNPFQDGPFSRKLRRKIRRNTVIAWIVALVLLFLFVRPAWIQAAPAALLKIAVGEVVENSALLFGLDSRRGSHPSVYVCRRRSNTKKQPLTLPPGAAAGRWRISGAALADSQVGFCCRSAQPANL